MVYHFILRWYNNSQASLDRSCYWSLPHAFYLLTCTAVGRLLFSSQLPLHHSSSQTHHFPFPLFFDWTTSYIFLNSPLFSLNRAHKLHVHRVHSYYPKYTPKLARPHVRTHAATLVSTYLTSPPSTTHINFATISRTPLVLQATSTFVSPSLSVLLSK